MEIDTDVEFYAHILPDGIPSFDTMQALFKTNDAALHDVYLDTIHALVSEMITAKCSVEACTEWAFKWADKAAECGVEPAKAALQAMFYITIQTLGAAGNAAGLDRETVLTAVYDAKLNMNKSFEGKYGWMS